MTSKKVSAPSAESANGRKPWPIFTSLRERLLHIDDNGLVDEHMLGVIEAAVEAGHVARGHYGNVAALVKDDRSHVTRADIEADDVIREVLGRNPAFESFSYIDEESEDVVGADGKMCLVIDPIDGTTNYSLRIPFFSISIGVFDGKTPVLGVVYSPFTREMYVARIGKGSFWLDLSLDPAVVELNPLRVPRSARRSRDEHLERGLHAFCHGGSPGAIERMIKVYRGMKARNPKYRQFGCASLELCYVARGRMESFNMTGVNIWDVAGGCIIAAEAGAKITDFEGRPFDKDSTDLLAADRGIHGTLLAFIKGCVA